ncbi:uncharacterized protein LOC143352357 [Halictus rubicundus]|uniref:uncharacterized protein LOC143352357 n=1 Tax=Halictus rubicundus TaxID=77578 RepID=UPI0040361338
MHDFSEEIDDFRAWRRRSKKLKVYTCSYCEYESTRHYNVLRHMERIHWQRILSVCCGKKFFNKGDYYIHCEKHHPETRLNTTSRLKYKISKDSVALRYKMTCSDLDMENIPLICFLNDHRLRPYMKRLSSSSGINKTDETPDKDDKQTVEIAITSEQGIEKAASENLPAKKLILHRFRKSVTHKFGIPLKEQNNNDPDQVNFEKTTATKSVSLVQNWSQNLKWGANKENLSTFALSIEQKIDINLGRGITVPLVTQLHRDFLGGIDFDKYKLL